MTKSTLRLVAPTNENRTVEMPKRLANAEYRQREYLTPSEVERMMKVAGKNRQGHRDATMRSQVDFTAANLHVRRLKGSTDAVHPIRGDELRALRRLHREQQPKSAFMFVSERGSPFSTAGILRMVHRAGKAAKIGFPVHPHMLRRGAIKRAIDLPGHIASRQYAAQQPPRLDMTVYPYPLL